MNPSPIPTRTRSEFFDSVRKGLLLGTAVLALLVPTGVVHRKAPPAVRAVAEYGPVRVADFGQFTPGPDVRHVANWTVHSRDHQNKAFVIVDKKDARVYVFDPAGHLQATTPVLLGSAIGDDTVPGIGDKPIAQVLPQERTTPAGRFVAEIGMNLRGEDVVWVDYDAAVSMHRVLRVPERLRALASRTNSDNRMSFGCINLPRAFYEQALRPAVQRTGAVVYVLPETRSLREEFTAFYDVAAPVKMAQH
jgi:hypothetical protein